jgi:hypothetical protein
MVRVLLDRAMSWTTGICWAPDADDHSDAAAAPPANVMNSRRLMFALRPGPGIVTVQTSSAEGAADVRYTPESGH